MIYICKLRKTVCSTAEHGVLLMQNMVFCLCRALCSVEYSGKAL